MAQAEDGVVRVLQKQVEVLKQRLQEERMFSSVGGGPGVASYAVVRSGRVLRRDAWEWLGRSSRADAAEGRGA